MKIINFPKLIDFLEEKISIIEYLEHKIESQLTQKKVYETNDQIRVNNHRLTFRIPMHSMLNTHLLY